MTAETWTAVRESFGRIVESPPNARTALLESLAPEVRREVETLLLAHERAGRFIEPNDALDSLLSAGRRIGPYRLAEKIGEGGMGVVFRAERDDGEFLRHVAIKFAGGRLFAPEAERRFLFERQILARLDHPHIVRMLDGGVSEGRRFLVMELVDGEPVTAFASNRNLPLAERLRLFCDVLEAIRYAHQNLVIHRDIKPRNVLVTPEGSVKVLDFGVAQLLHDGETGPVAAQTALHPMTLDYASPEQIRGEPLTVGTDIYSLGVLLYELVTDWNPQSAPGASLDEAVRRVCDQDPPRPGSRQPGIPRDLDAIVLKAMAKDPGRRYSSAADLANDVQRFLDGRPVEAQPPSFSYLAAKFVRRNKLPAAIAAALSVSVLAGLVAFAWEARVAGRERSIAQRRFEEARRLISTVIFEIEPKLAGIPATTPFRKTLIDSTLKYLEAMARDAGDNVDLLRDLARSYVNLGTVQGDAQNSNLGDSNSALESAKRAEELIQRILVLDPAGRDSVLTAAHIYNRIASFYQTLGQRQEAAARRQRAVELAGRLATMQPKDLEAREALGMALFSVAGASGSLEDWNRTRMIYESLLLERPAHVNLLRAVALVHKNMSGAYNAKREHDKALDSALKARDLDAKLLAMSPSSPQAQLDLAIDLSMIGTAYFNLGNLPKALAHMRESVEMRERIVSANPRDARALDRLGFALSELADYRMRSGDAGGAIRDLERAARVYRQLEPLGPLNSQSLPRFAQAMYSLARLEKQRGGGAACALYRQSVTLYDEMAKRGLHGSPEYGVADDARKEAAACGR